MVKFQNLLAHVMRCKSLFLVTFALAFFAFNKAAHADTADSYLNITCIKDLDYFSIESLKIADSDNTTNKVSDFSEFILYQSLSNKPYSCKTKNHMITVSMTYFPTLPGHTNPDSGVYSVLWDDKHIGDFYTGSKTDVVDILMMYDIHSSYNGLGHLFMGRYCNLTLGGSCSSFDLSTLPIQTLPH